jgi:beta-glucosidase
VIAASLAAAVPVLAAVGGDAAGTPAAAAAASRCPWVTSTAPVPQRVRLVLAATTLRQLDDLVFGQGSSAEHGYAGHIPALPRLCLPELNLEDGPEGVGDGMTGVIQLPAAVAAAATWDPSAVRSFGEVIGSEEGGKGVDVDLGPTVNIVRDPRWGRAFESYGEDPYLSGQTAVADITGVQSQGVMAMVKHWAVYNQETNRNHPQDDAVVSDRTLREIYLPQFRAAVQPGHAAAVMCSYATVNGAYACENPHLGRVMDGEFGLQGFIASDWGATHSTVPSARAGLDMEMPYGARYSGPLVQAVQDGQVPRATVREMARRILTEMFRFHLFSARRAGSARAAVTSPAHAAVARKVAEQGTVLLKNDGGVLPLRAGGARSIAVIGDDAGPGAISSGGGSASVTAPYVITPFQGIAARAGIRTAVRYAPGNPPPDGDLPATPATAFPGGLAARWQDATPLLDQAVNAARSADVAVVFAGYDESEGTDRDSVSLAPATDTLIEAVARANPRTVVVLNTGSAVTMPWLRSVPAMFEAWYPGQEDGNAIAALLFGDVNPSGKLPVTFPRSLADVPARTPQQWPGAGGRVDYSEGLLVGYRWYDAEHIQPEFPFGFGLSYTSFRLAHLAVTPPGRRGTVTVRLSVTNTGRVPGAETVQVYVGDPASAGEPPRQLKGFRKVQLRPGETRQVRIQLDRRAFAYWNSPAGSWAVAPGSYQIMAGTSSASLPLHAAIRLTG